MGGNGFRGFYGRHLVDMVDEKGRRAALGAAPTRGTKEARGTRNMEGEGEVFLWEGYRTGESETQFRGGFFGRFLARKRKGAKLVIFV